LFKDTAEHGNVSLPSQRKGLIGNDLTLKE
jgi:hypothetical protein